MTDSGSREVRWSVAPDDDKAEEHGRRPHNAAAIGSGAPLDVPSDGKVHVDAVIDPDILEFQGPLTSELVPIFGSSSGGRPHRKRSRGDYESSDASAAAIFAAKGAGKMAPSASGRLQSVSPSSSSSSSSSSSFADEEDRRRRRSTPHRDGTDDAIENDDPQDLFNEIAAAVDRSRVAALPSDVLAVSSSSSSSTSTSMPSSSSWHITDTVEQTKQHNQLQHRSPQRPNSLLSFLLSNPLLVSQSPFAPSSREALVSRLLHAAPVTSLANQYAALRARGRVFTTGSAAMDSLLRGGVRSGEIVEVVGPSGCGKTQLCHQLALLAATYPSRRSACVTSPALLQSSIAPSLASSSSSLASYHSGEASASPPSPLRMLDGPVEVVYVDTGSSFCAQRLADLHSYWTGPGPAAAAVRRRLREHVEESKRAAAEAGMVNSSTASGEGDDGDREGRDKNDDEGEGESDDVATLRPGSPALYSSPTLTLATAANTSSSKSLSSTSSSSTSSSTSSSSRRDGDYSRLSDAHQSRSDMSLSCGLQPNEPHTALHTHSQHKHSIPLSQLSHQPYPYPSVLPLSQAISLMGDHTLHHPPLSSTTSSSSSSSSSFSSSSSQYVYLSQRYVSQSTTRDDKNPSQSQSQSHSQSQLFINNQQDSYYSLQHSQHHHLHHQQNAGIPVTVALHHLSLERGPPLLSPAPRTHQPSKENLGHNHTTGAGAMTATQGGLSQRVTGSVTPRMSQRMPNNSQQQQQQQQRPHPSPYPAAPTKASVTPRLHHVQERTTTKQQQQYQASFSSSSPPPSSSSAVSVFTHCRQAPDDAILGADAASVEDVC